MKSSLVIKLIDIKQFLGTNLTESKAATARTFNVNIKILIASIRRDFDDKRHEREEQNKILKSSEKNKILKSYQKKALDDFIRSLLTHSIQLTNDLIYRSIVS
jgi:hypothetical protein